MWNNIKNSKENSQKNSPFSVVSRENLQMEIPLIIPFAAPTKEAVQLGLVRLSRGGIDIAEIFQLHKMYSKNYISDQPQLSQEYRYRGFALLSKSPTTTTTSEIETEIFVGEIQRQSEPRSVWFIFNGMGSQWAGMVKSLMKFPACKLSLEKSAAILKSKNLDLLDILMDAKEESFENILHTSVSIAAIQIALVDLLSDLNIKPDGIIGHSTGELAAAYADNCLTAEQIILTAHARGQICLDMGPADGAMAVVALSWEEAMKKCPQGIYPACHNSKDIVTVSGPTKLVNVFVEQLQREGIFAKKVSSSNQAFHSKYIEPIKILSKESLDKIIPAPSRRSSRWISSSIPESQWSSDLAKTSSGDYHLNNLVAPVLFQEALEKVPQSAILIEIGPHCLLQANLKRSLPNCYYIGLLNENYKDNSIVLCKAIGKMFNCGLNPDLTSLYKNAAPSLTLNPTNLKTDKTVDSSVADEEKDCQSFGGKKQFSMSNLSSDSNSGETFSGKNQLLNKNKTDWLISMARVLGIKTSDLEQNPHRQLEYFGMDSFMCAEIVQMIAMKFAIFLSEAELSQLSLSQLLDILDKKDGDKNINTNSKKLSSPAINKIEIEEKKTTATVNHENKNTNATSEKIMNTPKTPKNNNKNKRGKIQNIHHTLNLLMVYLFSLCLTCLVLCILAPASMIFRTCVHIYLYLFHKRSQLTLMTGFGEEPFAMLNFNTVHVLRFAGTPNMAKIIAFLQDRVFNLNGNNNNPFERLKWGIRKSPLFLCWVKDKDFDLERHLTMEKTSSSNWAEDMSRLAKYYHNLKWDQRPQNSNPNSKQESRPWWEIRIVYSKKLEEFLLVFAWNHAYGDARSFLNLIQYGMADEKPQAVHKTASVHKIQPQSSNNKKDDKFSYSKIILQLIKFGVARVTKYVKSVHVLHLSIYALSQNVLDSLDLDAGRKDFTFAELDNHAASGIGKFRLSTLKSLKNPETGKPFNLNAVILYLISSAVQRIYKEERSSNIKSKFNSNFLAAVTWSPFEIENRQPTLENQSTLILTPVPDPDSLSSSVSAPGKSTSKIKDGKNKSHRDGAEVDSSKKMINDFTKTQKAQKIQDIQEYLTRAGRRELLHYSKGFYQLLSLFPHPLSCLILRLLCRQDFLYSNILAPFPSNMTCLGGYQLKDIYAFIKPHPLSIVALSNSFDDSLNISMTVPDRILKTISSDFHHLFFKHFQQEVDKLALD